MMHCELYIQYVAKMLRQTSKASSTHYSSFVLQPSMGFWLLHLIMPVRSVHRQLCPVFYTQHSRTHPSIYSLGTLLISFPLDAIKKSTLLFCSLPSCQSPHHFNLWAFINLTLLTPPINLFNSWLVLILHPSLSWTGPKIFIRILLWKVVK
jgi:hypothetical protein